MAMRKAGLDSALDFTKFVVAADGGLIAFITGATFTQQLTSTAEKALIIVLLICLAGSIIAGILVYMRVATMLGDGRYDLNDPHLKWPGVANVFLFAMGASGLSLVAIFELFLLAPAQKPEPVYRATIACRQPSKKMECVAVLATATSQQNHK